MWIVGFQVSLFQMDYPTFPIYQHVPNKHVKNEQLLFYNESKDMAITRTTNNCMLLRQIVPPHPIPPMHMQKIMYTLGL